jgi:hypothetical protein
MLRLPLIEQLALSFTYPTATVPQSPTDFVAAFLDVMRGYATTAPPGKRH